AAAEDPDVRALEQHRNALVPQQAGLEVRLRAARVVLEFHPFGHAPFLSRGAVYQYTTRRRRSQPSGTTSHSPRAPAASVTKGSHGDPVSSISAAHDPRV